MVWSPSVVLRPGQADMDSLESWLMDSLDSLDSLDSASQVASIA